MWDLFKIKLKESTIYYCKSRAESKKTESEDLSERTELIDEQINNNNSTIELNMLKQERVLIKAKLDNFATEKSQGYYVRPRAQWIEDGEKHTRFFAGLENCRQSKSCIECLITDTGDTVREDGPILNEMVSFYEKLYSTTQPNKMKITSYLKNINIPRVLSNNEKKTEL